MEIPSEIPTQFVIATYGRLGFELGDRRDRQITFRNSEGALVFHEIMPGDVIDPLFALEDMERQLEAIGGFPAGWARETWLPTLLEILGDAGYA